MSRCAQRTTMPEYCPEPTDSGLSSCQEAGMDDTTARKLSIEQEINTLRWKRRRAEHAGSFLDYEACEKRIDELLEQWDTLRPAWKTTT